MDGMRFTVAIHLHGTLAANARASFNCLARRRWSRSRQWRPMTVTPRSRSAPRRTLTAL